jgi:hypothetical protein
MTARDEYGRRTWDEAAFETRFQSRMQSEQHSREHPAASTDPSSSTALKPLTARASFVALTDGINRRKVIGENIPLARIGHYSCPACQLYFKDSTVYLRHLNSPEHTAALGMSLKVADATDAEVLARVEQWENFYSMNIPVPPLYPDAM